MITLGWQDGWSPLIVASRKGHVEVVRSLIEAGVNINHTDKVGTRIHCFFCTPVDAHSPLPYCYTSLSMYVIKRDINCSPITCPVILYMHAEKSNSTSF